MLFTLLATIARTASVAFMLLAVVFSFRIAQEAWLRPLSGSLALGCILVAALCLCPGSLRDWLHRGESNLKPRSLPWAGFCTAAVWWFAGLLIIHQIQTGPAVNWCLWLPLMAAEIWSRQDAAERIVASYLGRSAEKNAQPEHVTSSPNNIADFASLRPSAKISEEFCDPKLDNSSIKFEDSLTQQWTRQRTGGEDSTRGLVRVPFAADQILAVMHVSFCPAFTTVPELEASVIEGAEAEVKATHVYPYGARLEVRRSTTGQVAVDSTPSEAVVEILAAAPGADLREVDGLADG